jgi:hypothetical protein
MSVELAKRITKPFVNESNELAETKSFNKLHL